MSSHYERVLDDLAPGMAAKSEDINHIQSNIEDALKSVINDLHDGDSFILGEGETDFLISPAPKRGSQYIDTQNTTISENYICLSTKNTGYKQKIRKSKTSMYSVNVKLRNLYRKPVSQFFELRDPNDDNSLIAKQSVEIPANTDGEEFEIVFAQYYLPTGLGVTSEDAENGDVFLISEEVTENPEGGNETETNDTGTLGISEYDFIVKPINMDLEDLAINGDEDITITPDTFGIYADITGGYGKCLYQTNNDGLTYEKTIYDLVFKDVYATAPTYLCNGGSAIIDGERVDSLMTHIEVSGGSNFGDVISLIYLDLDGFYQVSNSDAFFNTDEPDFPDLEDKVLPIAFITTYMSKDKPPEITQDDISQITRPRSMYERVRRLEKHMKYNEDLNVPPRIKYTLSGDQLLAPKCGDGTGIPPCDSGEPCISTEDGTHTLTTDSKGNLVWRSTSADVFNVPITFKGNIETNKGINAAKNITKNNKIHIDTKNGIVTLDTYVTKEAKTVLKNTTSSTKEYNTALSKVSAGNTAVVEKTISVTNKYDPWALVNKPNTKAKAKPRSFVTYSGITSLEEKKLAEYPAMTLWIPKAHKLKKLTIPVTKFKNMKNFKIAIFKRQSKNNLKNTVWLDLPAVYESGYVSLDKAKKQNGYQVLSKSHTFSLGTNGITFKRGQYVVVIFGNPINKAGAIITKTVPTLKKRDFLIKYRGTTKATHFRIKGRAYETWADSAEAEVDWLDYYTEGSIESGIVDFTNTTNFNIATPNIVSVLPTGTVSTPKGCSYQLWIKTNSTDWTKATLGKTLKIKGTSFQWKLDLKGTDEATPTIDTSKSSNGYGLHFAINMDALGDYAGGVFDDTGECMTTNVIRGNNILGEYVGDQDATLTDRFSRYEFVRLWAEENSGKIVTDIHASNKTQNVDLTQFSACSDTSYNIDVFSLIYADLELKDFTYDSVDYSNYDPATEYDEHNLRLKLDADTAYNDTDVSIFNTDSWNYSVLENYTEESSNEFTNDNGKINIDTSKNGGISTDANTILAKISPSAPLNLTQFNALKLNYSVSDDSTITGIGFYISLNNELEGPSFDGELSEGDTYNGKEIIREESVLPPDLNMSSEELVSKYYNKIIEIILERNGVSYKVYYEYYIDANGEYQYRIVKDINSYIFYQLPDMSGEDSSIIIPIDKDNDWYQYVQEIGIVAITKTGDSPEFSATENTTLELSSLSGQIVGYNKVFTGNDHEKWTISDPTNLTPYISKGNSQPITSNNNDICLEITVGTSTNKISNQTVLNILNNKQLLYFNNDSFTKDFNHLGIQMGSSFYLYKGMLRIDFHDKENGEGNVVFSLDVPSMNYVATPSNTGQEFTPKMTQIYKKISDDYLVRSISLNTGSTFSTKMKKILGTNTTASSLKLYINDIIFYEAETLPILHKNIRAKIYNKAEDDTYSTATLRKFGVVATYN